MAKQLDKLNRLLGRKQLSDDERRKLLAAAEIVQGGDMAVVKALFEFQDFLDATSIKKEVLDKLGNEMDNFKNLFAKELQGSINGLNKNLTKAQSESVKNLSKEVKEFNKKIDIVIKEVGNVRESIPVLPPKTDLTDIFNRFVELEKKIPAIPEPENAEDLRNKLEVLNEDERLKASALSGLEGVVLELIKEHVPAVRGGGGGVTDIRIRQAFKNILLTEEPVGAIDSVNKTYTVSQAIFAVMAFSLNGEVVTQLPNYTIAGNTITFSTALPSAYSGKDWEIKYIG